MGDRITFRGRGRGCAERDYPPPTPGALVPTSIIEPRVKFIKGWLTGGTDPVDGSLECGPLTKYPMIVTPDQLAEIFYRVKEVAFTQGELGHYYRRIKANPGPMRDIGTYSDAHVYSKGYGVDGVIPSEFSHLFTDYSATSELAMWALIGGANWLTDTTTSPFTFYYGDFATAERRTAKWLVTNAGFFLGDPVETAAHSAYTYNSYFHGGAAPDGGIVYAESDYGGGWSPDWCESVFIISRYVAYTDADSPFDPAAKLYLGIRFDCLTDYGELELTVSKETGGYGTTALATPVKLKFKLSGSDMPECVIGAAGAVPETVTGTDFILKATEWWPYATTTGDPAWDTATGLPINGGPGA